MDKLTYFKPLNKLRLFYELTLEKPLSGICNSKILTEPYNMNADEMT